MTGKKDKRTKSGDRGENPIHRQHRALRESFGGDAATRSPDLEPDSNACTDKTRDTAQNTGKDGQTGATRDAPETPLSDGQSRFEMLREFGGPSAISALESLLEALEWSGSPRLLKEVLPHFDIADDVDSIRAVLARLNYATFEQRTRLSDIAAGELPCLLVDDDGECHVLLSVNHDRTELQMFNGLTREVETVACSRKSVRIYTVAPVDGQAIDRKIAKFGWVATASSAFRGLFLRLLAINLLINLAALAVPIFIMGVYGTAIASKSLDTLVALTVGILIVVTADWFLRKLRTRALAYMGARFDGLLAISIFQQLLYMPLSLTQAAPLGTQITRIKQFDGIRNLFTGALGTAILDLPFMLIFLAVIAVIGGWLVVVPLALMAAYALVALVTLPTARRYALEGADVRAQRQNMLVETFSKHRAIRDNGIEDIWLERFQKLNAEYIASNFKVQQLNLKIQTVSQTLMMLSGIGTLAIGTVLVLGGTLSIGGLIASMALVWRVLAPIQTAFLSLYRISQVIDSIKQINRMMTIRTERKPGVVPTIFRRFNGQLNLNGVSFRYAKQTEPALRGVNLAIKAGEVIAVTGASGSGKSTILRILAGLYVPQAGAVQVDGLDLRQLDMGEYRAAVGYMPDVAEFFYGTIAQNLRFANPTASNEQMEWALKEAGISLPCKHLPDGLETRLNNKRLSSLSDSYKQELLLARAYVKHASILLMDEPANFLDNSSDSLFMARIEAMKGGTTVLFTTQRPSHMKLADRVIVLHEGMVVMNDHPDKVIPTLVNKPKKIA